MLVNTESTRRVGLIRGKPINDHLTGCAARSLPDRDGKIDETRGGPRRRFAIAADNRYAIDEYHAKIGVLRGALRSDHRLPSLRQHFRERCVVHAEIELKAMFRRLLEHGLRACRVWHH